MIETVFAAAFLQGKEPILPCQNSLPAGDFKAACLQNFGNGVMHCIFWNDDENPLLARLPVGIRGPIKHMTIQDHYMRVTTTRGKELILMRMGDAVGMMPQGEGMQVHRSHWVGLKFIANTSRENGQAVIIMDDGATYPVSGTYVKSVREAGVL